MIKSYQRKYAQDLRKELSQEISNVLVEQISLLEEYGKDVIKETTRVDFVNMLPLRDFLTDLFIKVKDYDSSNSSVLEKMTKEAYDETLSKATSHILEIKAKDKEQQPPPKS